MSTEVIVTGTGMPLVVPDRAGPGVLIRSGGLCLQFDVGRSTSARIVAAGTALPELSAVFLTHYHSDHVVGLQDLVLSHWIADFDDVAPRLPIVAPNGPTIRFCERMLDIWDDDLDVRALHNHRTPEPKIDLIGFDTPGEPTEVWSHGDVRVIAGPVRHEPVVGAVGYRVETPDGIIVITGDTLVCDEVAALASGADVVIYEAMRFDWVYGNPPSIHYITEYHADTRLIGAQMAELDMDTVMLTHLIPPPASPEDRQAFVDDLRGGGYTGTVVVCDDLERLMLGS